MPGSSLAKCGAPGKLGREVGGPPGGWGEEEPARPPGPPIIPGAPEPGGGVQLSPEEPSSLRLRHATLGFRFRSRTCCSRVMITSTALFMMPSFVIGLSDFRWVLQILPNSFNASLMSLILTWK